MNKIKSFRSFSDVLAHEAVIKLAVENNAKRSELSTKIASILDSMEITSFEGLEEEQKTAIISQLFGEISEEETEENLPEVSDEEEQQVDEAKFVKDFNKDVLNAKTREEVLELYPNAEFFTGKSDHFFGELDNNLFFKAYYTKAQKEFSIKSVYSEKGSNYVHLYNRIGESLVTEGKSEVNAFLSMISKDYQFDKKHDDYTGFLNTDPSDMDDVAIEFINNVDKYKSLMKKHGLSLEPGYSDEEAIFVKESLVNEMKKRSPYIKDDLVYNTRTETVGIVRTDDDGSGEVKTDADGNVDVDELEKYNPIKNKHQNNAKVAPSTEKEVSKRGLFNPFKNESVVTEAKEDDVIIQLRKIVKDKQNALVVDTKSKKKVRVDMQSASLMVQVYDALKQQSNKDKFVKSGIVAMGHMAYKLMKNEGVNEGDGLWANIRAKKARGGKPAHKNSKAHKDAVKAGDKIKKDESVNEAKAFVVMFKVKKDINNRNIKPASAAYSSEVDAKKFLKSVEKDGGKAMIIRSNISGMKVNEAKDEIYFKSYTHAIEAAEVMAGKKGYTIEDDELFNKVGMNSKRPSVGKTTKVNLELLKNGKPQKKMLHIQVYGMKNGYELNAYIN